MPEIFSIPITKLPWFKRPVWIVCISIAIFIFGFSAWFGWLVFADVRAIKNGSLKPLTNFSNKFSARAGSTGITTTSTQALVRPDSAYHGDANSQITFVEFGDFSCPFCEQEFPIIRPFIESHPGIKFVFRDFPLTEIHPQAFRAAEAARCANEQGKFWAYHDQLYLNQQDFSDAALSKYAQTVGLGAEQFKTCLTTEKYKQQILRDMQDGAALGVRGTPTFFIQGIKIEGVIPADAWEEIYARLKTQ